MDRTHPIPFLRAPLGAELPYAAINGALEVARDATGMEVAFFAELNEEAAVFRALAGDSESFGWRPGDCLAFGDSYCAQMVTGALSHLVTDARANPLVSALSTTADARIGSYVGAPVWRSDGLLYGSFCALSHEARPDLSERDARLLASLGRMVAGFIEEHSRNIGDFRQVVEATAEGIWVVDVQGITRYVNDAMVEIMGRGREEVIGVAALDVLSPRERAIYGPHMEARRRGERGTCEAELHRPDGDVRHLRVSGVPLSDPDGNVTGAVATVTDLTDEVRAQQRAAQLQASSVQEAEEKFQALAQFVPHKVWSATPDGTMDFVNQQLVDYIGPAATTITEWTDVVHPEDLASAREAWHKALSTGDSYATEYRLRRHDGEMRDHVARAFLTRDDDGAPRRWYGMLTDVTDERAQQRLTALVESSADAIIGHDLDGRITSWNAAATGIYGLDAASSIGRPIDVALGEDAIRRREHLLTEVRAGRAVRGLEMRQAAEDGTVRVLSLTASPVRDEDGTVLGASLIALDVTAARHAEEQVRSSEARLLEAQRVARLGNWEIDRRLKFVACSEEARRLLELPAAPTPLSSADFFASIHPDDLAGIRAYTDEVLKRGGELSYEHRVCRQGGAVRWIAARGRVVVEEEDGTPANIVGTVQDVTELREAEAALREERERLAEAQRVARMGDFVWDLTSEALQVSEELVRLLGIEGVSALRPEHYLRLVPREERHELIEAFQRSAGSRVALEHDHRFRRPDGDILWLNVRGEVALDPDGNPCRVKGTVQDVTAQRAAELALRARDEAERASAAKSEFLSRMSHELRTPLNAILGFGQLLELDELEEEAADNVAHILRAGRHLLALINEILELSRIEAGVIRVELEPVSVPPVVGEILELLGPLAADRGIALGMGDAVADACALADPQRLKQILLNVISNAIHYNREGGSVSVAVFEDEALVSIGVQDTGPGIAEHELVRLFSPFERLGAEDGDVVGSGLGLAVSRSLAEAMGGSIAVHSTAGEGATFTITLPRSPSSPAHEAEEAAADARVVGSGARRVLCVEDNPSNLRLVERVLARRNDIAVTGTQTADAALQALGQWVPDLVLLDLDLPDRPGSEVLDALRRDPATAAVPVVVLSADALPEHVARISEAGASAYLTKPLDVQALLRTVDEMLAPLSGDA